MSIPTGGRRARRGDTEEHPRTSPANSTRGWARPWRGGVDRHQGPQTPIRWARADGPDFRRRLLLGPPGVGCRSPRRRPSNASVVRWIGRDRPVTPSDHGRCSCVWVPGLTNGSPAVPGGGTTDRTGGLPAVADPCGVAGPMGRTCCAAALYQQRGSPVPPARSRGCVTWRNARI